MSDPEVDDGNVHVVRSVDDRAEILQFRGDERTVGAAQTGQSRLPVTGEVGAADSAHSAAKRPVRCHQM